MRIKGSDLRRIIKEEVSRAARLSEVTTTYKTGPKGEKIPVFDFSDEPVIIKGRSVEEIAKAEAAERAAFDKVLQAMGMTYDQWLEATKALQAKHESGDEE